MTSANPSPASRQESVAPLDASPSRVSLPEWTRSTPSREMARADLLLSVFVVALAFLTASTAARNSDVWLHLAAGRALANGASRWNGDLFGPDAMAGGAHSWLYDLVSYGLYDRLGGSVLVFLKAGLAAVLAALLLRLGSRGRGLAWPAAGATLAVLALGGRLLLQPALLSAVLLAVTLWLLDRARNGRTAKDRMSWLRAYGPISLLFVLWTNLDDWFLLGPVTVALYLLGEAVAAINPGRDDKKADLSGLALFLGVGLLACLVNPSHVHGLALPAELGLSATTEALGQDPVLKGLFISPFEKTYFRAGAIWNVAGIAYATLALLSLLSFVGSRDAWRGWRLPVWLGLFGLSAWSARAVPFFAVAAGPILALNLQDLASRTSILGPGRGEFLWPRLGRAMAILVLLGLLVAAWPGWLQAPPYEMRRWALVADPSVREAAEQLAGWHREGLLGLRERGFHFSPETANYFAWFCPADKGAVDSRLHVSAAEAADYVAVRRAILDGPSADKDWPRILRDHRVNHIVLYDNNVERVQTVYRNLVSNEKEWPLLLLTGRTVVFGWVDPERAEKAAVADLRWRPDRAAYHPAANQKAPAEWPGRGPQAATWWQAFVSRRPDGSPDRDRAALLLLHFDSLLGPRLAERQRAWQASQVAGAVGLGGCTLPARLWQGVNLYPLQPSPSVRTPETNPTLAPVEALAVHLRGRYLWSQDDAPPELLLLTIRAARRALHANPDDSHAYLILGQAYLRMVRNTRERAAVVRLPFLERLREVQASAAFNQALLLQPDLLAAHAGLAALYQSMGQWDLTLTHLREEHRLVRSKGRPSGEDAVRWDQQVSRLEDELRRVEEHYRHLLDVYQVNAANLGLVDRAALARQRGLAAKALDLLLTGDVASFGRKGAQMELSLLLLTGRLREVREWMLPDQKELLGEEDYLLLRLQLAAACGDYAQADAELLAAQTLTEPLIHFQTAQVPPRHAVALAIGKMLLDGRLENQSLLQRAVVPYNRGHLFGFILDLTARLQKSADMTVLRGLLALEQGDTAEAARFFRRAVEVSPRERDSSALGGAFLAQPFVDRLSRFP